MVTKSAQETQKLGQKIADNLSFDKLSSKKGRVIALYGELGSGKTTFIQGLAKGLEIKERILSPTFIMMRQYPITSHQSLTTNLFHIDLYRIEDEKDIRELGLQEIWNDPKNIVAIEWAEKIKKVLPKKRIDIYFEYLEDDERKIIINYQS